ncbi:MAG: DUF1028 domain-containing protein [Solirubrobacteraceae bacterium]
MTFTILGRSPQTGQLGAATATSDLAVGSRVLHGAAGVGIAATQHRTDPRLGPELLERLRAGDTAVAAMTAVANGTPHRAWRQLGVLDATGGSASYSGPRVWPVQAQLRGEDCLVVANMLVDGGVATAIVDGFARTGGELADRLLVALIAGEQAGGEAGDLRSAALLVVERESFPLIDLRIDNAVAPLAGLQALWTAYRPHTRAFVTRALDPDNVQ